MFSADVERWLQSNTTPQHRQFVKSSRSGTRAELRRLGVSAGSQLHHFYVTFGAATCRGWYDLNEPDEIADATQYSREEWGVSDAYIALTSFEGEGVVLYALKDGAVYDVELRHLDAFLSGSLAPIAKTFEGYLRWCMTRQAEA